MSTLLGVYVLYERAFRRIDVRMYDKRKLARFAKRPMIRRFGLRLGELREFATGRLAWELAAADTMEEVVESSSASALEEWKPFGKQRWRTMANRRAAE